MNSLTLYIQYIQHLYIQLCYVRQVAQGDCITGLLSRKEAALCTVNAFLSPDAVNTTFEVIYLCDTNKLKSMSHERYWKFSLDLWNCIFANRMPLATVSQLEKLRCGSGMV